MNDMIFLKESLIAHRGYFDNLHGIPENSILSFRKAIAYGYAIELDIHVLKDNTVVVFHDDDLKRMAQIDRPITSFSYHELNKLYLLNTIEKIPTLGEVLAIVNGQVPILIEFKSDKAMKRLIKEAMKLLSNYKGQYAIQSFNPTCVYYFKRNYPNIPRGQLSQNAKNMLFNFITKPDFISYDIKSYKISKIAKWKKKRVALGWTIRNKEEYINNKDVFNNLICENMENYYHKKS